MIHAMKKIQEPNALSLFCANPDCSARGKVGPHIGTHGAKRYRCTLCNKTFRPTQGTVFAGLHYDQQIVSQVLCLLAHGCPRQAIVHAFEIDERTVQAWETKAGSHAQQVQEHVVSQNPLAEGAVQVDELRVKRVGGVSWVASAIETKSRFWLGGLVRERRDSVLAKGIMMRIMTCFLVFAPLLLLFDGWPAYLTAFRRVFFYKEPRNGRVGRCKHRLWERLVVGRLVKQVQGKWELLRETVAGSEKQLTDYLKRFQAGTMVNTAYIERLNATFRQRLASFTRKGRMCARQIGSLTSQLYLVGVVYNFCTPHDSLRLDLGQPTTKTGRRWQPHTPAQAAGMTDHRWTITELFSYRIPPPPWQPPPPPKKRGRPRKEVSTK